MFRKVRWPETDGAPVCPHCGGLNAYECRRPNGLLRFRCRACKAAFVLLHKLREAMAEEMKGRKLGGEGVVVEVDGGYFGGYVKPANHRENRRDRRLVSNQNGKRKAVVIIRERNGRSRVARDLRHLSRPLLATTRFVFAKRSSVQASPGTRTRSVGRAVMTQWLPNRTRSQIHFVNTCRSVPPLMASLKN
jgi:hypothetical protein